MADLDALRFHLDDEAARLAAAAAGDPSLVLVHEHADEHDPRVTRVYAWDPVVVACVARWDGEQVRVDSVLLRAEAVRAAAEALGA